MSLEEIIDRHGWTDIWHPAKHSWYVGFWNNAIDLICIKRCDTDEEGERYLSPEGRTIEEAIALTLIKQIRLG